MLKSIEDYKRFKAGLFCFVGMPYNLYELNAANILAVNTLEKPQINVVTESERQLNGTVSEYIFPAHSITALVYKKA